MIRAQLHDIGEFAEMSLSDRPPLLIDPWMAAGSVTLLFGPPSAGKTHATISIASALARGEPLWGVFPTQRSRVLIVQADMNTALYQERVRPNALQLAGAKVLVTDGFPIDITTLKPSDPLVQTLREFAPEVVFVDTLRKTHNLSEIDDTTPDRVYGAWRALLPGAAFVFLHHSRKLPTSPDANRIVSEAFRGSTAWAASADTIIAQRRVRRANNPAWMTRLQFVRTRSCEEPASLLLQLTPDLQLTTLADLPHERKLLEWISSNPRASRAEAVRWLSTAPEGETPLCSQATAYRAWDRVIKGELNG